MISVEYFKYWGIHKSELNKKSAYDFDVGTIADAVTGSCEVFTCSVKLKSLDGDVLAPRTMTVASGTSFAGLIGSTTDSCVDDVSDPL